MWTIRFSFTLLILTLIIYGCSGVQVDPVQPSSNIQLEENQCTRLNWGLWEFRGDICKGTLDVIPIRVADIHLNALVFLEPPANKFLKVASPIHINGNVIDFDIALMHPFPGHTELTGFDVKGIVITRGTETGYYGAVICRAGKGETRLLNPDGYTRWWSPVFFPPNPELPNQGYIDGLLGTPNDQADFLTEVQPYKYFCDDLDANEDLSGIKTANRGLFRCNSINRRHYVIEVDEPQFVFNYAVDASWAMPIPSPPKNIPGDFPITANQPEAYRVEVQEIENTLYYDGYWGGGGLVIDVTAYTWRPVSTTRRVIIEARGIIGAQDRMTPVAQGDGWAKYRFEILFAAPPSGEPFELLIAVESKLLDKYGYDDYNGSPGVPYSHLQALFFHTIQVNNTTPPTGGVPGSLKGIKRDVWVDKNPNGEWGVRGEHVIYPLDEPYPNNGVTESFDGGRTWVEHPDLFPCWAQGGHIFLGFDERIYKGAYNNTDYQGRVFFIETAPGSYLFDLVVVPYEQLGVSGSFYFSEMLVDPEGRIFYFYQLNQQYDDDRRLYFIVSDNGKPFQGPFLLPTQSEKDDGIYVSDITVTSYGEIFIAYWWESASQPKAVPHLIHGNYEDGFVMDTILPVENVNGYNKWFCWTEVILPDENDPDRIMLVGVGPDHTDGSEECDSSSRTDIYVSFSYDGGLTFSKWRPVTSGDDRHYSPIVDCFVGTAHLLPNGGFEILGYYHPHKTPYLLEEKDIGIIVTSPDDGTTCSTASFIDPCFYTDHAVFFAEHILVNPGILMFYILETERY